MRIATALIASCVFGVLIGRYLLPSSEPTPTDVGPPRTDASDENSPDTRAAPALVGSAPKQEPKSTPPRPALTPGHAERLTQMVQEVRQQLRQEHGAEMSDLRRTNHALKAQVDAMRGGIPANVLQELESSSVDELRATAMAVRSALSDRLLTPSESIRDQYAWLARDKQGGVARILQRGKYDKAVIPRGGGAYWSFVKSSNSYDDEPDLEWQGDQYSSGFYGGTQGFFLNLGEQDLGRIDADAGTPPGGLSAEAGAAWPILFADPDERGNTRAREVKGLTRAHKSIAAGRVPIDEHATYLLRSILPGEHDVLVVFQQVASDEHGRTLAWRVLKTFEVKRR